MLTISLCKALPNFNWSFKRSKSWTVQEVMHEINLPCFPKRRYLFSKLLRNWRTDSWEGAQNTQNRRSFSLLPISGCEYDWFVDVKQELPTFKREWFLKYFLLLSVFLHYMAEHESQLTFQIFPQNVSKECRKHSTTAAQNQQVELLTT